MMDDNAPAASRPPARSRLAIGLEIRGERNTMATPAQWAETLRLLDDLAAPGALAYYYTLRKEAVSRRREFRGASTLARVLRRADVMGVGLTVEDSRIPMDGVCDAADAVLTLADGEEGRGARSLSLFRFVPENSNALAAYLAAAHSLLPHLRGVSGHLHVSHDMSYVFSEASDIPSEPYEPRWPTEATHGRIRQLAAYREQCDTRVFGAYWGTLLSANLVDTLGGVRRVQSEAPVAHTEVLDGGAMYLQVTDSPEPITTPAMKDALPRLEAYLEPVSVPVSYFRLPPEERERKPLWKV